MSGAPGQITRSDRTKTTDAAAEASDEEEVDRMNLEIKPDSAGYKTMLAIVQTMVTIVMAPFCLIFMSTVWVDIIVNTQHDRLGIAFWVMVSLPCSATPRASPRSCLVVLARMSRQARGGSAAA